MTVYTAEEFLEEDVAPKDDETKEAEAEAVDDTEADASETTDESTTEETSEDDTTDADTTEVEETAEVEETTDAEADVDTTEVTETAEVDTTDTTDDTGAADVSDNDAVDSSSEEVSTADETATPPSLDGNSSADLNIDTTQLADPAVDNAEVSTTDTTGTGDATPPATDVTAATADQITGQELVTALQEVKTTLESIYQDAGSVVLDGSFNQRIANITLTAVNQVLSKVPVPELKANLTTESFGKVGYAAGLMQDIESKIDLTKSLIARESKKLTSGK